MQGGREEGQGGGKLQLLLKCADSSIIRCSLYIDTKKVKN